MIQFDPTGLESDASKPVYRVWLEDESYDPVQIPAQNPKKVKRQDDGSCPINTTTDTGPPTDTATDSATDTNTALDTNTAADSASPTTGDGGVADEEPSPTTGDSGVADGEPSPTTGVV